MERNSVLIVDDDTVICNLLSLYLKRYGYEPEYVNSGGEALEKLAMQCYRAVITDLKMAGISGHDIIRHVKETTPDTVVVMITGSCDARDRELALVSGADYFFFKPFTMNDIVQSIEQTALSYQEKEKRDQVSI